VRVSVKFTGHSSGYSVEGEVVQWGSMVEEFYRDGNGIETVPMQVPCVVLDTGAGVVTVPLQRRLYDVAVEVLERHD